MTAPALRDPRDVLFDEGEVVTALPVCDHYAGIEARMRKSLQMQAELGPVFDVTLDGEDGAPAGGEVEHAQMIAEILDSPLNQHARVGVRVPQRSHPAFEAVLEALWPRAGRRMAYLMLPKALDAADFDAAAKTIDASARRAGIDRQVPLHALVETHGALRDVQALAAHPRIESLSFGLMDFVSAHRGAVPYSAMSARGQFEHALVTRAKTEIAAACHAHAKTPSHSVVIEFKDHRALQQAAEKAAHHYGYTRMWSIHPDQIRIIIDAFAPSVAEVDQAIQIITAAQAADWAPIRHGLRGREQLHDRASYRYFWQVLERAHRTSFVGGPQLPLEIDAAFFKPRG